jgi:nucleolar protein 14
VLFPPSDLQHAVTTPALLLIARCLEECRVRRGRDLAAALFLCGVVADAVTLSRRWLPESIRLLTTVVAAAAVERGASAAAVAAWAPLPSTWTCSVLAKAPDEGALASGAALPLDLSLLLADDDSDERERGLLSSPSFDAAALAVCYALLHRFALLYAGHDGPATDTDGGGRLPAYASLFAAAVAASHSAAVQRWSRCYAAVATAREAFLAVAARETAATDAPLRLQQRKPVPLKMFAPDFDEHVGPGGRRPDPDRARAERKRLERSLQRERRGALRELRRDAAFLAAAKQKEIASADADRREKVRRLESQLMEQQHASKEEKREKARLKASLK